MNSGERELKSIRSEYKKVTDAFENLKSDHENVLAVNKDYQREIYELRETATNLHQYIEKLEVEKQSEVAREVKAFKDEKILLQSKHEKVCKDMKVLKSENEELAKETGILNVALKSSKKDAKEISVRLGRTIENLENENKKLQDYKVEKSKEDRHLKTQIKKVNKKLKLVNEKEAKVESEKFKFERIKKEPNEPITIGDHKYEASKDDQNNTEYVTSLSTISPTFYSSADITTYPSMVSHWITCEPNLATLPTPATKMDILEMFELNRKALKELYEKTCNFNRLFA